MTDGLRAFALILLVALVATTSEPLQARSAQTEAALGAARAGDPDRAVVSIEASTKASPRDADAWMIQGSLLCSLAQSGSKLKAIGRAKRCRDAFAQAVVFDPVNMDANIGLMQFYYGAPSFAGGDKAKGDAVIEATRATAPALHALMLGIKAVMAKDSRTAERQYLRAVALAPTDARMHTMLISTYASQKAYPQAFAAAQAGFSKLAGDPAIRFQFGRTAAISGQKLAEGLAHLDALAATETLPTTVSRAGIAFRRGMILAQSGRRPEARAAYAAAKKLDVRLAREVDPELAKLKS